MKAAEWRIGRGWDPAELHERLGRLSALERNYAGSHATHRQEEEWAMHRSRSRIGRAPPGPPEAGGPFDRGRRALAMYAFSDPSIVEAHFRADTPLAESRMLLEFKPLVLRYLCGVVVGAVRDETSGGASRFGFRYDTLEGHLERGSEWFLLEQSHESGLLTFQIEATWRHGDFPNWWSRLGFGVVGGRYQRRWHVRAHQRMSAFVGGWPPTWPPLQAEVTHQGPKVVFRQSVEPWVDPEVRWERIDAGPWEGPE